MAAKSKAAAKRKKTSSAKKSRKKTGRKKPARAKSLRGRAKKAEARVSATDEETVGSIDATAKLPGEHAGPWPPPAAMTAQLRELVSDRWAEYGLGPEPEGL